VFTQSTYEDLLGSKLSNLAQVEDSEEHVEQFIELGLSQRTRRLDQFFATLTSAIVSYVTTNLFACAVTYVNPTLKPILAAWKTPFCNLMTSSRVNSPSPFSSATAKWTKHFGKSSCGVIKAVRLLLTSSLLVSSTVSQSRQALNELFESDVAVSVDVEHVQDLIVEQLLHGGVREDLVLQSSVDVLGLSVAAKFELNEGLLVTFAGENKIK
jgi:hypothetical protein